MTWRVPARILVVAAVAVVLGAAPAHAIHELVIERDQVTTGEPGSIVLIDEVEVEAELVGASCAARAEVNNQESTHPNTNLIFTTGSASAVLANIEDTPGQATVVTSEMVVGETVRVELQLGEDGISSARLRISFVCPELQPTTTTTSPTTTTAPSPTSAPSPPATTSGGPIAPATTLPSTGSSSLAALWIGGVALMAVGLGLWWRVRPPSSTSR
jgi:LPXTG-motif cell wall-anchored protein